MKLPLVDPWSSTSPQHIKAHDIPALDVLFTTAAPVSVPERLAAMAGTGAADPEAAHVSPHARAYAAAQIVSAQRSDSRACSDRGAGPIKQAGDAAGSAHDSFVVPDDDTCNSESASAQDSTFEEASAEDSDLHSSGDSVHGPIRGGCGAYHVLAHCEHCECCCACNVLTRTCMQTLASICRRPELHMLAARTSPGAVFG